MKATAPPTGRLFTPNFLLLWATAFAAFGSFHILLPTLPLYVISMGGTESQVGLVTGIITISAVLARPWIGKEADRRGKRRVLLWGVLALAIAALSYNLAATIGLLLILRLVHGVAWAATTTPATALVADIAPATRRGEAMGYYGTASNVAMAIAPLLGIALVGAYGFNLLFVVASGMALLALAVVLPIREPRPQVQETASPINPQQVKSPWATLVYRPALLPSSTILSVTLTYGSLVSFLPLLASRNNINPGIFFTVFAIFLIIARPIGGKLSDAVGREGAIIPGMAALALGIGLLAFASDLPHFLLTAALYGTGLSFVYPALMALTVDRAAPESRGAAMGTFSAAFDLGIGLGSIVLGLLLEKTSFQVLYLTSAGIAVASLAAYLIKSRRG